jgi:hypothetical protein
LETHVFFPSPVGKPHTIVLQVYNSYTDASNKLIDHKFYKSLTTKLISNAKYFYKSSTDKFTEFTNSSQNHLSEEISSRVANAPV